MMNLFSVFDPTSFMMISFNWMIVLMFIVFVSVSFYMMFSMINELKMKFYMSIKMMFNDVSFPNYLGMVFVCVVVFMYLIMMNLLSLFPFIFSSTAHPVITMGVGVLMWMSFFLMGWMKNFMLSAAHLVPEGSPMVLAPFMVLIESISHLIRPFTLSIRLAANMMAGHLILGLLSMVSLLSVSGFMFSLIIQEMMLILEFGVALIQGFVFSILLLLYALEYY